jgi:hypothetical protein
MPKPPSPLGMNAMRERAIKGLMLATLLASLASAMLLAAFGCALPESLQSGPGRLASLVRAVSECNAPPPRRIAPEALQRSWDRFLLLPKH